MTVKEPLKRTAMEENASNKVNPGNSRAIGNKNEAKSYRTGKGQTRN